MILTGERRIARNKPESSAILSNANPKLTGLGLKPVGPQPWVSANNRLISRVISIDWYAAEASSRMLDLNIVLGIF